GGKIRSSHLLRELARQHQSDLFTFYPEHANDKHASLRSELHEVFALPLAIPEANSWADRFAYARNLLSLQPYSMRKYCGPAAAAKLRKLLTHTKYDAVICDFFLTGGVMPWDLRVPTILFTHNVEAQIWLR